MDSITSFAVLYTKVSNKKRKAYSDGYLSIRRNISTGTYLVLLIDESGEELKKSNEREIGKFVVGDEIIFGQFSVQIEEETKSNQKEDEHMPMDNSSGVNVGDSNSKSSKYGINSMPIKKQTIIRNLQPQAMSVNTSTVTNTNTPVVPTEFEAAPSKKKFQLPKSFGMMKSKMANSASSELSLQKLEEKTASVQSGQNNLHSKPFVSGSRTKPLTSSTIFSTGINEETVSLDPSLAKKMRPHQIDGANFLIRKLINTVYTDESDNSCKNASSLAEKENSWENIHIEGSVVAGLVDSDEDSLGDDEVINKLQVLPVTGAILADEVNTASYLLTFLYLF